MSFVVGRDRENRACYNPPSITRSAGARIETGGIRHDRRGLRARPPGGSDRRGRRRQPARGQGCYTLEDLTRLRERVEEAGLQAVRHQRAAGGADLHKIKLGLPGREEQIDNWCRTIRNAGEAGIPNLIYFFSLRSWYGNYGLRTDRAAPGKGGSELTSFDYDAVKQDETGEYWYPPVPESVMRRGTSRSGTT